MKNFNTRFAVMVNTDKPQMVTDKGRVCIFTLRQAKEVIAQYKTKEISCQAIPYCEGR